MSRLKSSFDSAADIGATPKIVSDDRMKFRDAWATNSLAIQAVSRHLS